MIIYQGNSLDLFLTFKRLQNKWRDFAPEDEK